MSTLPIDIWDQPNGERIATRTARHSTQRRTLTFAWKGKAITIPDTKAAWHFGAYRITADQIPITRIEELTRVRARCQCGADATVRMYAGNPFPTHCEACADAC